MNRTAHCYIVTAFLNFLQSSRFVPYKISNNLMTVWTVLNVLPCWGFQQNEFSFTIKLRKISKYESIYSLLLCNNLLEFAPIF